MSPRKVCHGEPQMYGMSFRDLLSNSIGILFDFLKYCVVFPCIESGLDKNGSHLGPWGTPCINKMRMFCGLVPSHILFDKFILGVLFD